MLFTHHYQIFFTLTRVYQIYSMLSINYFLRSFNVSCFTTAVLYLCCAYLKNNNYVDDSSLFDFPYLNTCILNSKRCYLFITFFTRSMFYIKGKHLFLTFIYYQFMLKSNFLFCSFQVILNICCSKFETSIQL